MDKKYNRNFKRPSSSLGKRPQRASLSGHNDSRLATISETCPTPSTSKHSLTATGDESFSLGYDSLCDETLKTPLSYKFNAGDQLKTPKFTSSLRAPLTFTGSYKKVSGRALGQPEQVSVKSVSLQTSKDIDNFGTPPIVLRKRLNLTTSVFHDLEEEYNQLQEFTTLEKQVLSVEGLSELQAENVRLKDHIRCLSAETKSLTEKFQYFSEETGLIDLQAENASLKIQLQDLKLMKNPSPERQLQIAHDNVFIQLQSENAQLKSDLGLLLKEKESLELQNKTLNHDLECVTAKCVALEENHISTNNSFENLEKDNSELKEKYDKLTINFDKLKEDLKNMSTENKSFENLEKDNSELKEKYDKLTIDFDKLKEDLKIMSTENKNLIKKYEMANNKLIDLEIISDSKETKRCLRETELSQSLQEAWDLLKEFGIKNSSVSSEKLDVSKIEEPTLVADEKFKLLQNTLNEKIAMINCLQHNISVLESSTVSNIDNKNLMISTLLEKVKCVSNCLSLLSSKVKSLEDNILSKDSELSNLKEQITSIKTNSIQYITHVQDNLKTNELWNEVNFKNFFEDFGILHDEIVCDQITADNILEGFKSKILFLIGEILSIKEQLCKSGDIMKDIVKENNDKINCFSIEIQDKSVHIESLLSELEEKKSYIESLSTTLKLKNTELDELSSKLNMNVAKMTELSCVLEKNDTKIEELSTMLKEKDNKIDGLCSALTDKEKTLEKYVFELMEKDTKLDQLSDGLKEKDSNLAVLSNKVDELSSSLKEREIKMDKLSIEFESKDTKINEFLFALSEKENMLKELYNKIDELSCTLNEKERKLEELVCDSKENDIKLNALCTESKEKNVILDDLSYKLKENEVKLEDLVSVLKSKDSELDKLSDTLCQKVFTSNEQMNSLREMESNLLNLNEILEKKNSEIEYLSVILSDQNLSADVMSQKYEAKICALINEKHCLNEELNRTIKQLIFFKNLGLEREEKICFIKNELEQSYELLGNIYRVFKSTKNALEEDKRRKDDVIEDLKCQVAFVNDEINHLKFTSADKEEHFKHLEAKINNLIFEESIKMDKLYSFALSVCDSNVSQNSFEKVILSLENKFEELNNLVEHYRNVIISKEEILSKRVENYKISSKEMQSDKVELEEKLNDLEKSYESLLSKSQDEASRIRLSNDSRIDSLKTLVSNMELQIASKTSEMNSKNEELAILNEKILHFEEERNEFFTELTTFGSTIKLDPPNINNFSDITNYIIDKFEQSNDLVEHLRNIITSKEDKIARLNEEIYIASILKLEKTSRICSLEKCIVSLKEKIESGDHIPKELLVQHLIQIIPHCDSDTSPCRTFDEIIEVLKKKFSEFDDFKEHLRNIIESKNDQISNISNNLFKKQSCVANLESQMSSTLDELLYCRSELNSCKENELSKDNDISSLENKIVILEEQLGVGSAELHLLRETLYSLLNDSSCRTSEDLLDSLVKKITNFDELKEHLKNTIQSKNEKISKLLKAMKPANICSSLTEDLENQARTLNDELLTGQSMNPCNDNELLKSGEVIILTNRIIELEDQLEKKHKDFVIIKEELNKIVTFYDSLNQQVNCKIELMEQKITNVMPKFELFQNKCVQKLDDIKCIEQEIEYFKRNEEVLSESEKKFHVLITGFEMLKSTLKNELTQAFNSLAGCATFQEAHECEIHSMISKYDEMLEINRCMSVQIDSFVEERKLFFMDLQQLFLNNGTSSENIISFDQALNLISLKVTEFSDLKEHFKNLIYSKEDKLCRFKHEVISTRKCKAPGKIEVDTTGEEFSNAPATVYSCGNDGTSLETVGPVTDCYSLLSDLASLLYSEPVIVDVSNYEEILNNFKVKYLEFLDLIEHLRNRISSQNDKISGLVRDAISNRDAFDKTSSNVSKLNQELLTINSLLESYKNEQNTKDNIIRKLDDDCKLFKVEKETSCIQIQSLEQTISSLQALMESKNLTIKNTQESLDKCREDFVEEQSSFFHKLGCFISSFGTDVPPLHSYDEIIDGLKVSFTEFNDVREHLRNTIKSKEDQIENISECYKTFKEQAECSNNELKNKLSKILVELSSLKEKEQNANSCIETLQGNICDLRSECSQVHAEFTLHKEKMTNKITALEEIKEHLENKIESKTQKFIKLAEEFSLYKENCLIKENQLKEEISFKTEEFILLKSSETNLLNQISQLDDCISRLKEEVSTKERTTQKLTALEEIKEHLENKIESKTEKLIKLAEEFSLYKENCLIKENQLKEEISVKTEEFILLKSSETNLLNQISQLDDCISRLKEEVSTKDEHLKITSDKLNNLSGKYDILVEERNKFVTALPGADVESLEKKLSNIYTELDTYKSNEVSKDTTIHNLELEISNLKHVLVGKAKEILVCKNNMDNLSQNIVELIRDKESFFTRLLCHPLSYNVKDFEEIVNILLLNHSNIFDLNEQIKNMILSKNEGVEKFKAQGELLDEFKKKNAELNDELSSLKGRYESIVSSLEEYTTKPSSDAVLTELDQVLSECFNCILPQQEEDEVGVSMSSIKGKINQICIHIQEFNNKIKLLGDELEVQITNNKTNENFINTLNADFSSKIESTNQIIYNLSSEISSYKNQLDEKFASKDLEIGDLQNEICTTLSDFQEIVSLNETQSHYISSLVKAYMKLLSENNALVYDCHTSLKMFHESDIHVINEAMNIAEDLMMYVQELHENKVNNFSNIDELFLNFENSLLSFNENYSMLIDSLFDDTASMIMNVKSFLNFSDDLDCSQQVIPLVNILQDNTFESFDFISIDPSYFDDYINGNRMVELIDSISEESKLIDSICLSSLDAMYDKQMNSSKHAFNISKQNMTVVPNEQFGHPEMSLLMSVMDQTTLETSQEFESPTKSVGKSIETSALDVTSPSPEKTLYILPEGRMNTSEVQLEKTLYLSRDNGKKITSAVDPLKAGDKTLSSGSYDGWLNFGKGYTNDYLDESINEFHDAQDSVNSLTSRVDPLQLAESELIPGFNELKHTMGFPDMSDSDFVTELAHIISTIDSVKSIVRTQQPDLLDNNIDNIFREACNKILLLEENLSVATTKIQTLMTPEAVTIPGFSELKNTTGFSDMSDSDFVTELGHIISTIDSVKSIVRAQQPNLLDNNIDNIFKEACNKILLLEKKLSLASTKYQTLFSSLQSVHESLGGFRDLHQRSQLELKEFQNNVTHNISLLTKAVECWKEKICCLESKTILEQQNSDNLRRDQEKLTLLYNNCIEELNTVRNINLNLTKSLETCQEKGNKNIFNTTDFVEELQKILRKLDCVDEFDLKDGLAPVFSKIHRRLDLLKEYHSVHRAAASICDVNDLNYKIRMLEADVQDANNFKFSFATELHSLKPDLEINELLKRPLAELHTLMITEIMTRESVIISNLKDQYENKISSLKDHIHQYEEKDKRRAQWVSEVESDNEQLNIMSKKLKEDINSANEKLENKRLCEKLILQELLNLEKKIKNEPISGTDISSENSESDFIKKSDALGDILLKLQTIIKGVLSDSSNFSEYKYKEAIKTLQDQCASLKDKVGLMENLHQESNKENIYLKNIMNEEKESYERRIFSLNEKLKNVEFSLGEALQKIKVVEENVIQEHEHLQREKAFSLKILKENEYIKEQLEKQIENQDKINAELSEAKETVKVKISKYEDEITSLMNMIKDLKCNLKLSQSVIEERDKLKSELFQSNENLSNLKEEFSSILLTLESENKHLKNEINRKHQEISILSEKHQQEIMKLKDTLNDNVNFNSKFKLLNEDFKIQISKLESELSEKEATYRDSISALMREREVDHMKIKGMEEMSETNQRIISELGNKLQEQNRINQLLSLESEQKSAEYLEGLKCMEGRNKELDNELQRFKQLLEQKEIIYSKEIAVLNKDISEYISKINQLNKCIADSKETDTSFSIELLKLFPEFNKCSVELVAQIKSKLMETNSLKEELEEKRNECLYLEEDYDQLADKLKEYESRIGEVCRAQFESENKCKSQLEEKTLIIKDLENKALVQLSEIQQISKELKLQIKTTSELKQRNVDLESKYCESIKNSDKLTKEIISLKNKISQISECKECKQLIEQVIHYKAKLHLKDVKIAELAAKTEVAVTPLKERNTLLERYKERVSELEDENTRLKVQRKDDNPSGSLPKEFNNQVQVTKLEARIAKLEKDREFLKRLCEKRAATIQSLKQEQEPRK